MEIYGYVAAVLVGIVLGLLGGGGAILTVPLLVYFFGITPVVASSYSLFLTSLTSLSGSVTYLLRKSIDFRLVAEFGLPSIMAVFVARSFLLPAIPDMVSMGEHVHLTKDEIFMLFFSVFMILSSVRMIANNQETVTPADYKAPNSVVVILSGVAVGLVTGLLGAGGGFIIIPILVTLFGLSMQKAVGTSLMIISINSICGFCSGKGADVVDWPLLLTLTGMSILGIFLGVRISRYVSARSLKLVFAGFLLILAAWILWSKFN